MDNMPIDISIIKNIPDLLLIIDDCGIILYSNDKWNHDMGYSSSETINKHIREFVEPKDYDSLFQFVNRLRSKTVDVNRTHNIHMKTKSSGYLWIESTMNYVDGYFICLGRDITRRIEDSHRHFELHEALMRSQEMAHVGNWELDLETNTLSWSNETYRIFGLSPQMLDGNYEVFLDTIHPDDILNVHTTIDRAIFNYENYDIEHRILRPDGSIRYVHQAGKVVRDADGFPMEIRGIVQDITDQKEIENSLRFSREALMLKSNIRDTFLNNGNDCYYNILSKILDKLNSYSGFIGYLDKNETLVFFVFKWQDEARMPDLISVPKEIWMQGDAIWAKTLRDKQTYWRNSDLVTPGDHMPIHRAISCPVIKGSELIGIIVVANKESDYTYLDKDMLEVIADCLASILRKKVLPIE